MNEWVYASITDIEGKIHTIAVPKNYESFFKNGLGIDGSSIPGFASVNKSDLVGKPDMDTFVKIPWRENEYFVLMSTYYSGKRFEKDPKNLAHKVDEKLKNEGYIAVMRPEIEFFVLNTVKEGNNHYFEPPYGDETFDYRKEVSDNLMMMGIPVRYHHHENASGQIEIELLWIDGIERTADYTIYTKLVSRWIAKSRGFEITYIPKISPHLAGSGMHLHIFLKKDGKNIFRGENDISQEARYFIGGIMEHIRYIAAITNPTITSYKRLCGGLEAPRYISWGYKNRSTLIRVPARMKDVEIRNPDPSANPYLAFSLLLMAGLDGLKRKIEPPEPIDFDLYSLGADKLREMPSLPSSLEEAIELMNSDSLVREVLGGELYDTFVDVKRREIDEFQKAVTDWEINRYRDI